MPDSKTSSYTPGLIALFGSGETSPSGQKIFDALLRRLPNSPQIAMLETPAGFELNSDRVIGRVAEFVEHRLQNYNPRLKTIPARRRGTEWSPDNPQVVDGLLEADLIFMGPGSPTYAVRQLRDSLAWYNLVARHRLGASIALASAATISISRYALPVYEIYKVGEDLHWKEGLDFFGSFGLPLVFIPHWNNNDGGAELDTSHCFIGLSRFEKLVEMLPRDLTIVGIDEKTGLILDLQAGVCQVIGSGGVTLLHTGHYHTRPPAVEEIGLEQVVHQRNGHVHQYRNKQSFPLSEIGDFRLPGPSFGLPHEVWDQAIQAMRDLGSENLHTPIPTPEVLALVEQREAARRRKDWPAADRLRQQIAASGWQVMDTPDGPKIEKG